jgi:hypothetical protein
MKFHKIRLTHMSFQILEPKRNTRRRPPHPRNRREKMIQDVTGTLLYYGCAVDSTILPSLSSLATEQAKPTVKTKAMVMQLLDYLATQEEAIISYNASDMILQVHSDAGYANEKGARSRAGGHFFLSNNKQRQQ